MVRRIEPGPGQESVWDYPRPPALVPSDRHVVVRRGETLVAETRAAYRVLETSHPPTWYLPPDSVVADVLRPASGSSVCEWKGVARYADVLDVPRAAWAYDDPTPGFVPIAGYYAFHPAQLECFVDGERVRPQEGGFYAGWITDDVVGPFKGAPGTLGW